MSALFAVLAPLALTLGVLVAPPVPRAVLYRLAPWAPLALLWPLLGGGAGEAPTVLLGMSLVADETARPVLWLTVIGWGLGGWFALKAVAEARRWFWSGWLGALTGMHVLLLAGDIASFYVGYATLSLSAYLLVTHARSAEAWRAGRVYLVMALVGEAAILVGVLLVAGELGNAALADLPGYAPALVGSPGRWLLFAGFAVKLGILPLHVWLPLAHPVAPVPASAVLSGIIVKAGLLGWLRFVPAADADPVLIGYGMVALGLLTAFGGVALGLGQQRLKTILAYSTISQMGLLLMVFGLTFVQPSERAALLGVLGVLVLHHGLNKASLFLASGSAPGTSRLRLGLFALPALALAAAPLTTGFLAKGALKGALALAPVLPAVGTLLSLTSTATALLLWKALRLARQSTGPAGRMLPAWPAMVLAAVVVPWLYAGEVGLLSVPTGASVVDALWPLLIASVLIAAHLRYFGGVGLRVPEGDVVVGLERAAGRLAPLLASAGGRRYGGERAYEAAAGPTGMPMSARLAALEGWQRRLPVIGLLVLVISALMWALVWWGG